MQKNSLFGLLGKLSSPLAAVLLVIGAALAVASHYGLTENRLAGTLTIVFAAVTALFALAAVNYANYRTGRRTQAATEAAQRLADGETFDEAADDEDDLMFALRQISDYLEEKAAVTARIAGGDFAVSVTPRTESDALGRAFARMLDALRFSVQTQDERERLENSIKKLLDEVSEVAAGDLTVHAEVSSEMTGAIAGAFNSMTRELRSLIKQVKDVTFQVSTSAKAIDDTTAQLERGSEAQASQISRTTSAISQMALQIQEVSANAALSAQVAADSLGNARYGTQAVQDNINAMNSIRKQVQETAKRIKKLGERSQEISQIVALIDDLSDRTSLLALNANLQASAAGEAGKGFALVAEEVERLADRSTRLTQQIAALTQTIQSETKDVVASMEETIHEVVVGSTLADRAGQTLIEIEQVSTRLAGLIQSISESANRQAQSSDDISKAMANISKVTELVQTGTKRAADSVKMLVKLSDELHTSVAPFKLPEDRHARRASQPDSGVFLN